eukprot:jgi/Mesvir1/5264/Mv15378-RA.1
MAYVVASYLHRKRGTRITAVSGGVCTLQDCSSVQPINCHTTIPRRRTAIRSDTTNTRLINRKHSCDSPVEVVSLATKFRQPIFFVTKVPRCAQRVNQSIIYRPSTDSKSREMTMMKACRAHTASELIRLPQQAQALSSPGHMHDRLHSAAAAVDLSSFWGRTGTERLQKHSISRTSSRRFGSGKIQANIAAEPCVKPLGRAIRDEFPILKVEAHGKPLVYLDNAATSQKPRYVLDVMAAYYEGMNSNVHRGVHYLGTMATEAHNLARTKVAKFVNAARDEEIVFTRNASEAINLVAYSWGMNNLSPGDEIISTVMEHHSNLVPWQLVAQKTGAKIVHVGLTKDQTFDMDHFRSLLSDRTKLVAINHVSNALGCTNPVREVCQLAHARGAKVLIDACQSVPHMPVDVQSIGCDWLVASGHKMCGPTGIGFLYGKYDVLKAMPPYMGGGEMIVDVFLDHSTYADPPMRFEAGTPAIAEAIALGAAVDYLTSIGMDRVHDYEVELATYLYHEMAKVPGITLYGPRPEIGRAALCSFNVEGLHGYDIATLLDNKGIAIRSGHHCTQPLHRHLGIAGSARASLYIYNTKEEVDVFVAALTDVVKFFRELGM